MSVSSIIGANGLVPVQSTAASTQVHLGQSAQWVMPQHGATPGTDYYKALTWTLTPAGQFPDFYQGVLDISGSLSVGISNVATTVGLVISDSSNAAPSPNKLYTSQVTLGAISNIGIYQQTGKYRLDISQSMPYAFTSFPAGQPQNLYLNLITSGPSAGGLGVPAGTYLSYTNTLTPSTLVTDQLPG